MITTRHTVMFGAASASSPDLQRCEISSDVCQSCLGSSASAESLQKMVLALKQLRLALHCLGDTQDSWLGAKTPTRGRTDPKI